MKNFESGLKKLNKKQVRFISEKELHENDLYDLARSMYMIVYKSDVKLLENGQAKVGYAQEDTDIFKEKFNKIVDELDIKNSKEDIEMLFNIICELYSSTAMLNEKRNSFIPINCETGLFRKIGIKVDENINEVPVEYLEQIKQEIFISL